MPGFFDKSQVVATQAERRAAMQAVYDDAPGKSRVVVHL